MLTSRFVPLILLGAWNHLAVPHVLIILVSMHSLLTMFLVKKAKAPAERHARSMTWRTVSRQAALQGSENFFKLLLAVQRHCCCLRVRKVLLQESAEVAVRFDNVALDGLLQRRLRFGLCQVEVQLVQHVGQLGVQGGVHRSDGGGHLVWRRKGLLVDWLERRVCFLQIRDE